jgi:hypothetical protein
MSIDKEDDYQHNLMIPLMEEAIRDAVRKARETGMAITYLRQDEGHSEIVVERNGIVTVLKRIPNVQTTIKPGTYRIVK